MKKVVTEFDAEKQSLRMYFRGWSFDNINAAGIAALVGAGMACLGWAVLRGADWESRIMKLDWDDIGLLCTAAMCAVVALGALFAVACLLFSRERYTLDKSGFRHESWLGPWRYWWESDHLENVMLFYVLNPDDEDEPKNPTYDLHVVLRRMFLKSFEEESFDEEPAPDSSLIYCGNDPEQLQQMAALANALLDALKDNQLVADEAELRQRAKHFDHGYFPDTGFPAEAVTCVEVMDIDSPRLTPASRPDETPWQLESELDGSVFWQADAFSKKKNTRSSMSGCLVVAIAVVIAASTTWGRIVLTLENRYTFSKWFFEHNMMGAVVGAVALTIWRCREILKPVRWIIIRVNRHELRHESRTLGIRRTRGAYPLGGLARIALEQRAECSALVFENAAGEPLAEIPNLTQDEARWMRDEILRNF